MLQQTLRTRLKQMNKNRKSQQRNMRYKEKHMEILELLIKSIMAKIK